MIYLIDITYAPAIDLSVYAEVITVSFTGSMIFYKPSTLNAGIPVCLIYKLILVPF